LPNLLTAESTQEYCQQREHILMLRYLEHYGQHTER
jgi:hypothetical protein